MANVVSEQPALAPPKAEPSVSRRKFAVAYLVLAAIVGAAVGLVVVFAGNNSGGGSLRQDAFASWAPGTTGTLGVREIARHVSSQYHLENGAQFTSVVAGPMQIESAQGAIPVTAVLVRSGRAGVREERIDITFPQAGVFYQLAGTAQNRSIPGAATVARGQLVRREALELALYTFHSMPQADYVVVFMPPPAGVPQTSPLFDRAVFLSRTALAREARAPVASTLPPGETKMTPTRLTSKQAYGIEALTAGRVFHWDFQQAPDQSAWLVLSPVTG